MPRPFRTPGVVWWLAAATCCAACGPGALAVALAAAAGTLFEAAPFVLVAEALPAGRLRVLAKVAGCGCGGTIPGALSLSAVALCWLTFGPLVTLARTLVAIALVLHRRGRLAEEHAAGDAFAELLALAPGAAAAAVASSALATNVPAFASSATGIVAALGVGTVLGSIAPCGTAAVAIAAALAPHLPFAAAGVLATGGLMPRKLARSPRAGPTDPRLVARGSLLARAGLTAALAAFATGHSHGFVNPRLGPLLWLATAVAAAGLRRPASLAAATLVLATMLLALACGSPQPPYAARETQLDDAFAGERLTFTGSAHRRAAATVLERFAITCCRADASPVSVATAPRLRVPDGTWVTARGTLERSRTGLVLRLASWRRIAEPSDPFIYR